MANGNQSLSLSKKNQNLLPIKKGVHQSCLFFCLGLHSKLSLHKWGLDAHQGSPPRELGNGSKGPSCFFSASPSQQELLQPAFWRPAREPCKETSGSIEAASTPHRRHRMGAAQSPIVRDASWLQGKGRAHKPNHLHTALPKGAVNNQVAAVTRSARQSHLYSTKIRRGPFCSAVLNKPREERRAQRAVTTVPGSVCESRARSRPGGHLWAPKQAACQPA